jgi:hypothetical protein
MTNIQTNIRDLKKQLEDLQSITNANIARLQIHLDIVSSSRFGELSYKDQLNHREALSDYGFDIRNYIRDNVSKIDKIAFDIFLLTRHNREAKYELEMLADIEHFRSTNTPAKDIPFCVFKAMIADKGIPVDDRNKLIKDRGDKRFKELL